MESLQDMWSLVLAQLGKKFSDTILELWFNHLELAALSDTTAVLISDSDMKADIVNKRYREILGENFEAVIGFRVDVIVISEERRTIDRAKLQDDVSNGLPLEPFSIGGNAQTPTAAEGAGYRYEHSHEENAENTEEAEEAEKAEVKEENKQDTESAEKPEVKYFATGNKEEGGGGNKGDGSEPFMNKEYTFENFIVGSSNKFAHAACVAVANNPAYAYNPLFIYGPSGLGKTHLLYAITNRVREKNPDANIVYVKGETFTNQLIEAISTENTAKFREKYRQADIFLIDDVQFIAGKVSTQEEFFNTFNELYEAKKQIILTSDRPPKEIKTLEDRVKTRFEWGLIADIQPPDLELRLAILRKKAQFMNVEIPLEVLNYLAEQLKSNIRQIEGAIKRLGAYADLTQQEITIDMARENIADVITGAEPVRVTQDKIFAAVAKKYSVSVEDIRGNRRTKEIAMARHVCIYILRNVTGMSLPSIGKVFNRDHTTILSSIKTIEKEMRENAAVENDIDVLIKEIKNL